MPRTSTPARWAVVVFDADGDMGDGRVVGPFRDVAAADAKADSFFRAADRAGRNITVLTLPVYPGGTGVTASIDAI